MNIVNTNLNFILLEIIDEESSDGLNLILSNMSFFPRKLEADKYKRFELRLNGIENKKLSKTELNKFVGNYIDVEETKSKTLIFWCDQHKIAEFELENYQEFVAELSKDDWIENYQILLDFYYKHSDQETKKNLLETKFLNRLKNLADDELKKYRKKVEFFQNDKDKIMSLNERLDLTKRIEQIREQYISELRNNG